MRIYRSLYALPVAPMMNICVLVDIAMLGWLESGAHDGWVIHYLKLIHVSFSDRRKGLGAEKTLNKV